MASPPGLCVCMKYNERLAFLNGRVITLPLRNASAVLPGYPTFARRQPFSLELTLFNAKYANSISFDIECLSPNFNEKLSIFKE